MPHRALTTWALFAPAFFLLLLFASPSSAQEDSEAVDVRLVIDVSGSMKRNDPNNLRQPAVELLVELLPDESKAGVWTFGKWVNMLIPHKSMSEDWRDTARENAQQINSVGLYTNIGEALEKAAYDINYADKNSKKNIILLTDGMVDIDKDPDANRNEWRRIVDEVIPKLKSAGYTIHTIALSKNADRDLMDRLSVSTDGVADTAESADDLMKIFLKAFDAAVPSEQVALTDNSFVIDSSVEEFTALIFRKQGNNATQIITPDQQTWDQSTNNPDLRWHSTDIYDLITVKRPLEGGWGVVGEIQPDSRITVVSNLNLRLKPLPNNVLKGAELDLSALLLEDGNVLSNPDFISLMDVRAELFGGNSFDAMVSLWDRSIKAASPTEGRYETELPPLDKEGVYQVKVTVDGRTFSREVAQQITLRQAFGADVREQFEEGAVRYALIVNAYQQGINYSKTQVIASIVTPTGQKLVRNLPISELDTWQTLVTPDSEGLYTARVQVKGMTVNGEFFDYELDAMEFSYSAEAGMVEAAPEFEEPAPEPTPTPTPSASPEPTPSVEPTQEPAEPEAEEPEPAAEGLPSWVLYAALGLGNLVLFALGYFIFKKIMSGPKDDILDELDAAKEEPSEEQEPAQAAEEEPIEEDDEEEEPPMEDLDPDVIEPEEVLEPEPIEPEVDVSEMPEPSSEDDAPSEDVSESLMPEEDDDIDDLDAMAMDIEAEAEGATAEADDEEEDDMVTAMLKAQGLDLAEEELDDAISSLIDDLDDDGEEGSAEDDDEKPV